MFPYKHGMRSVLLDRSHYNHYILLLCKGPHLEQMMEQLRAELSEKADLPNAYLPCKGDICAAQFNDGLW